MFSPLLMIDVLCFLPYIFPLHQRSDKQKENLWRSFIFRCHSIIVYHHQSTLFFELLYEPLEAIWMTLKIHFPFSRSNSIEYSVSLLEFSVSIRVYVMMYVGEVRWRGKWSENQSTRILFSVERDIVLIFTAKAKYISSVETGNFHQDSVSRCEHCKLSRNVVIQFLIMTFNKFQLLIICRDFISTFIFCMIFLYFFILFISCDLNGKFSIFVFIYFHLWNVKCWDFFHSRFDCVYFADTGKNFTIRSCRRKCCKTFFSIARGMNT